MNELRIEKEAKTITTLEVAEMMEMSHADLLKKIEGTNKIIGIIPVFSKGKIPLADYFIETSYIDAQGKPRKCYDITRIGCDFLANKFTGETAIYSRLTGKVKNPVYKGLRFEYATPNEDFESFVI